MIFMNYNLEMKKQMNHIEEGSSLLLHACCAPCSSAVLERLGDFFSITIFYYNPNITEKAEYQKRVLEVKKLIEQIPSKYKISLMEGEYDPERFFSMSKGLENEKERGRRCFSCYHMRLEETAKMADQYGFSYFTTTLSLSPYKNSDWINEIGISLDDMYQSNFLYSDFKKENGYHRSIELSREYHLYRQDYCGCIYSKKQREREKEQ